MNDRKFGMDAVNRFFEHDYQDRGMVKWNGFYLSDHQQSLHKEKAIRDKDPPRPKQSLESISAALADAYNQQYPVIIQLSELDTNSSPAPDIQTLIHGYNAETIIINDNQFINLNQIQHTKKAR